MRLLADENIDAAIVARLRADGHDVLYVVELAPGVTDDEVFDMAHDDQRVIVTADKDFGELVFRLRRAARGVVLLRLAGLPSADKAGITSQVIREHGDDMSGLFTVVSPGLLRMRRPLP